jgi:hypothetical protein
MTKGSNITYPEVLTNVYDDDYEAFSVVKTPLTATLINGVLTANNTAASIPIDVSRYWDKTITVTTTTDCNVYVKTGAFSDNLGFIKTGSNVETDDSDRGWNCNNEPITFTIPEHCNYIMIAVDETGGSDCTLRVDLCAG